MPMHQCEGDCAVLVNLGGQTAKKQEKGERLAYCHLGMYDGQYDANKDCLENVNVPRLDMSSKDMSFQRAPKRHQHHDTKTCCL